MFFSALGFTSFHCKEKKYNQFQGKSQEESKRQSEFKHYKKTHHTRSSSKRVLWGENMVAQNRVQPITSPKTAISKAAACKLNDPKLSQQDETKVAAHDNHLPIKVARASRILDRSFGSITHLHRLHRACSDHLRIRTQLPGSISLLQPSPIQQKRTQRKHYLKRSLNLLLFEGSSITRQLDSPIDGRGYGACIIA